MASVFRTSASLLLLTLPCVASAQESIPTELALALLRFGTQRPPTILVGRAPESYAADVHVPQGGRVLGSLVSDRQTTVVVIGKGTSDSLRADIERTLMARGWKRFEPPFAQRGGFLQEPPQRYGQFCKVTSGSVNVSATDVADGMAQARLDFGSGRGMCDAPRRDEMMGYRAFQFPTLKPPAGSSVEGGRGCFTSGPYSSSSGSSTGTFLQTTMSASELLAHYGAQLGAQGWQPVPGWASAAWTMRDSTGATRTVTLSAGRPEATSCYKVDMSLSIQRD